MKTFSNNHIHQERKQFKEEFLTYHKNQKKSIGMFFLNNMSLNIYASIISYVIVYVYYYCSIFLTSNFIFL